MSVLRRIMLSGIDINAIPESNKLYYTATAKVDLYDKNSLGSKILTNIYDSKTNEGVIVTQQPITAISTGAFAGDSNITSIKLPNTIKDVGNNAFAYTVNLKQLYLSSGDIIFGSGAFLDTGITTVIISNYDGYNGYVDMISSNICIDRYASPFYSKKAFLADDQNNPITMGTIIRSIGQYAFAGISGLKQLMFSFSDRTRTYTIGKGAFYESPSRFEINTTLPSYIKDYAFYKSGLSYIDIDHCVEIGTGAFEACSINNETLWLKATTIGYHAFSQCILNGVIIEGSVKNVGPSSFANANRSQLSPTLIKRLYFTKSCKFEDGMFCDVFSYPIYDDPEGISRTKIDYCDIECQFPNSVGIANNGMSYAHIGELHITSDVTRIDRSMFAQSKIDSQCILPDTITSIEDNAFYYSDIDSLVMGANVNSIGSRAFEGCKFKYIDFISHTFVPTLNTYAFKNVLSDCKIIVPDSLYDEWIVAQNWKTYASHIIKKSDWDASQTTE